MRKSTIIVIFAIYILSILAISFFGMKVKIYNETKYVKAIEISVEAEDDSMFSLTSAGTNSNGDHIYYLVLKFNKSIQGEFPMKENPEVMVTKNFIRVSIIPHITYDSEDVANAREESITYKLGSNEYDENEWLTLDETGFLTAFKNNIYSPVYIRPVQSGRVGTNAIIYVSVI